MFEDYGRGPACPMCKKVAIKLVVVNGQKSCHDCQRNIRKGRPIKIYKKEDYTGLTLVEIHNRKEKMEMQKQRIAKEKAKEEAKEELKNKAEKHQRFEKAKIATAKQAFANYANKGEKK